MDKARIEGYRTLIALRRNNFELNHEFGHFYSIKPAVDIEDNAQKELFTGAILKRTGIVLNLSYDETVTWIPKEEQVNLYRNENTGY